MKPGLDTLYDRYRKDPDDTVTSLLEEVRRVSLRYALSKGYSGPEDIAQDFTLRVWGKLPGLVSTRGEQFSFNAWVHRMKQYSAIDSLRKTCKSGVHEEFDDEEYKAPSEVFSEFTLESVPENLKHAVTIMLTGYTQKETAGALGITLEALESRFRRAKKINYNF
jgi:DNA-directed RNA polymerase specialized sigma24 family protein